MFQKSIRIFSIIWFLAGSGLSAQQALNNTDTISVSLGDAEQRFVSENLQVLAAKYSVDISKAAVLQAGLWYNPSIYYSQSLYNKRGKGWFDNSPPAGNYDVQVMQLISLAAKRSKNIALAEADAQRNEYLFEETIRILKQELYADFISLMSLQQKINLYEVQILQFNTLIKAAEQQYNLGALAGNEVVRLKVERQDLKSELLQINTGINELQSRMKILLHYDTKEYILANNNFDKNITLPAFTEVLSQAEQNRPDIKLANANITYQQRNLSLQKAAAIPDMTLGVEYDNLGNSSPQFIGINAGLQLPLFNRNQGEVAAAKILIKQAQTGKDLQTETLHSQVQQAYINLQNTKKQLEELPANYETDLDNMQKAAVSNYNKRYIGLLEFLDQVRTYSQAKENLIDLKANYYQTIENLNNVIGTKYIK